VGRRVQPSDATDPVHAAHCGLGELAGTFTAMVSVPAFFFAIFFCGGGNLKKKKKKNTSSYRGRCSINFDIDEARLSAVL
jgi:hypothetical protein